MREKYSYLELFWSAFFRIWTEYGEMWENADQNNSGWGHFLRSVCSCCAKVMKIA